MLYGLPDRPGGAAADRIVIAPASSPIWEVVMSANILPNSPWLRIFFGGGGFMVSVNEGAAHLAPPFANCRTWIEAFFHFFELDLLVQLGVYFWVGLLIGSTVSFISGLWALVRPGNKKISKRSKKTQTRDTKPLPRQALSSEQKDDHSARSHSDGEIVPANDSDDRDGMANR
jgi:hypothetical protein